MSSGNDFGANSFQFEGLESRRLLSVSALDANAEPMPTSETAVIQTLNPSAGEGDSTGDSSAGDSGSTDSGSDNLGATDPGSTDNAPSDSGAADNTGAPASDGDPTVQVDHFGSIALTGAAVHTHAAVQAHAAHSVHGAHVAHHLAALHKIGVSNVLQPTKGGITFSAVAQQTFTGVIGSFNRKSVDFSFGAVVHWGDGSTSRGSVAGSPATGDFQVTGRHTYAAAGQYAVHVTVTSRVIGGAGLPSRVTSFTSVADVMPPA